MKQLPNIQLKPKYDGFIGIRVYETDETALKELFPDPDLRAEMLRHAIKDLIQLARKQQQKAS